MAAHWHYKKGQVVVGLYYMTEEGKEVYVWGAGVDGVRYRSSDGSKHEATEEQVKEWTPLDLVEFTGETDHQLPYVFDLNWDCKTVSQMIRSIRSGDFEEYWEGDDQCLLEVLDHPDTFKDPRYHVTAEDIQAIKKALREA